MERVRWVESGHGHEVVPFEHKMPYNLFFMLVSNIFLVDLKIVSVRKAFVGFFLVLENFFHSKGNTTHQKSSH